MLHVLIFISLFFLDNLLYIIGFSNRTNLFVYIDLHLIFFLWSFIFIFWHFDVAYIIIIDFGIVHPPDIVFMFPYV